jgi:hypothetical protein
MQEQDRCLAGRDIMGHYGTLPESEEHGAATKYSDAETVRPVRERYAWADEAGLYSEAHS